MVDDGSLRAKAAALAGFGETGADHLTCAQAVVRFAAVLPDASQDSVVLARYFGGGMKGMGQVCGALSGAAVSVGLRDLSLVLSWPDRASPDTEKLQQPSQGFEAEFGALTCRALIGHGTGTDEAYKRFGADDRYASCESYILWACDHLLDILEPTR